MQVVPTEIRRIDERQIEITWSDGQAKRYTARGLRDVCPCATCREKRTEKAHAPPALLPVLQAGETGVLGIAGMKPVGNYAYGVAFSDGHDTGIFTLEFLYSLGKPPPPGEAETQAKAGEK